jgi:transcriptional regulator with XRE-family HTH domain
MPKKSKPEMKSIPPICAAVKKLRQAYGYTLEQFSRHVGISLTSASRFELGKQIPRSAAVLHKLAHSAADIDLADEAEMFTRAFEAATGPDRPPRIGAVGFTQRAFGTPTVVDSNVASLNMFRLMTAVKLIVVYFRHLQPAIEEALGPALEIVDEVLRAADHTHPLKYEEVERQVTTLAQQREFLYFKTGKDFKEGRDK